VSTVGFVTHVGRDRAVDAATALAEELGAAGIDVVDPLGGERVDLVVAVGGDGTFLRGAHAASAIGAPVLGVKVGRMGFLTQVEPDDAAALIVDALAGRTRTEERLAVVAEPDAGVAFAPQWAMNEIMVEKRARHRLVRLRLEVDGGYVTTFSADGVIVATPTGSTAYSFSARGPIVTPDVACLVVTPIAAHMVFDRSLVLASSQVVTLEVVGEEPGLVSADGRETQELAVGSRVRIRVADRPVRFVRAAGGQPFLDRVREKFDLPGDPGDVGDGD
jgi:NAD+ kinase